MSCIIGLPMLGVAKTHFTPVTMFWLHNLLYFAFIDLFHGLLLPLTIISIPFEIEKISPEEKSFYVRTSLVLEPRRPFSAPEVLPVTFVDRKLGNGSERNCLSTLTSRRQRSQQHAHDLDQPIWLPLRAQLRPRSGLNLQPDLWSLSSQVEMVDIENHIKAPSTKVLAPTEQESQKPSKATTSAKNSFLDPKDFQHAVNSILRYWIVFLRTLSLSHELRKCSQNEHPRPSLVGPEVIFMTSYNFCCCVLAHAIFSKNYLVWRHHYHFLKGIPLARWGSRQICSALQPQLLSTYNMGGQKQKQMPKGVSQISFPSEGQIDGNQWLILWWFLSTLQFCSSI